MNWFDSAILGFLQQISQHSAAFDRAVFIVFSNSLIKTVPYAALLWGMWWHYEDQRDRLAAALAAALGAVLLTQFLTVVLPFRTRPFFDQALGFRVPFVSGGFLPAGRFFDNSSCFPSDHAALFAALATGIFFISRTLGVIAGVHCLAFICLPRIYMGAHFPTDILAGATIGVAFACLGQQRRIRHLLAAPALALCQRQPALFYSSAFVLTSQMTVLFTDARNLGSNLAHAAQRLLGIG